MWAWDGKLRRKVGVVVADIDGIRLLWFLKVTTVTSPAIVFIDPTSNPSFIFDAS